MNDDELRKKILEDIEYIKKNNEKLQYRFVDFTLEKNVADVLNSVLNFFRVSDFSFIDKADTQWLLEIENIFSPFKIAINAFIDSSSKDRLINIISKSEPIFEYMQRLDKLSETQKQAKDTKFEAPSLEEIVSRIEKIEKIPKEFLDGIKNADKQAQQTLELLKDFASEASRNAEDILNSKQNAEKQLEQLTKMRDHQISVELSEQFDKKTKQLGRLGMIMMVYFLVGILGLFVFNLEFNSILIKLEMINKDFLETFILRIAFGMPIIFVILVFYNEYLKSNKLYEEYEFKRISAITLFNNHSRLKNELGVTSEELSESLKVSMDRIFTNPVHSIFGDKSADANIGIEQLEKIISSIEKLKPKS
jgi:hypothetical protein